jgi:predicted component of type VI protein secretion system
LLLSVNRNSVQSGGNWSCARNHENVQRSVAAYGLQSLSALHRTAICVTAKQLSV